MEGHIQPSLSEKEMRERLKALMEDLEAIDANHKQRSPRSRSPDRHERYRGRSRSPDRDRDREYRSSRRERSPVNGHHDSGGYGSSYDRHARPPPHQDRSVNKEQMMSSIRESSQQDRRVYVGNLAYDVKWHHLKDFMRQGKFQLKPHFEKKII